MAVTQGKILKELHLGAKIMVDQISHPPSEAGIKYRLTSNQKPVRKDLIDRLLVDGLIVANEDGLPGIGVVQSYSIARNL